MSISPPPFSPARSTGDLGGDDDAYNNEYVRDDDEDENNSARSLISSFDSYKTAIDRLRSSMKSDSLEQQQNSLEQFKPLSSRANAWLYMRLHDDLFTILLDYLKVDDLTIQSTTLSILANIACDQSSHEQIFETDLIDIVCRKVTDLEHIDVKNRCFRLLGNICTVEDAARKMIDADLARSMGDTLHSCTNSACLHSTIRCARKLSTYTICRDPMLDSMCLLSICKQLFAPKSPLRKEAMKAVLEWNIESSDRSRAQLRQGEIFRFLIETIESKTDKEYRHIAFRLLNNLLRHGDMRTEFGLRQGLDFLMKMITEQQYQSTYEHFKFLGLYCVCCQEVNNRRLIKEDTNKLRLFFNYLEKYQYRSNFLDLLLTAIGQFSYDEQSLTIFVKQMQFIERMSDLLESVILVKYEINEKRLLSEEEQNPQDRKRMKTKHTTTAETNQRVPMMIDFNESLFTEYVENTRLEDEKEKQNIPSGVMTINIETRRRTEGLIFILLSKLSYDTTDSTLRRYLYNRRLLSLLLRYISSCDEPNPRSVRILNRLTKFLDSPEQLIQMGLPYFIQLYFYPTRSPSSSIDLTHTISSADQYLLDILLRDNRAFFQRLSWKNDLHRLKTIENILLKNIETSINTPFAINEILQRLNDPNYDEKFQAMLTLVATLKVHHFHSVLFDRGSGIRHLIDLSNQKACFWALKTLTKRCLTTRYSNYIDEFLNQLESHALSPVVTAMDSIQLNINNEQCINVNSHLLSVHSDYFKTLFNGSFRERHQQIIPLRLPEKIPIESFEHLNRLISSDQESIESDRVIDLLHLCDHFLFDSLPFRLAAHILKQFRHGHLIDFVDIVSKPNLISALTRAMFSHILTTNNDGIELFSKLLTEYTEELRTLIQTFVQHKCWFAEQYSPFLSSC